MPHRNNSAQSGPIVSDERIRNKLRERIHRAMHVERRFTRETLATETGVNIHTIDAITSHDVAKHRRIATEDALSIAYVLGDGAINALLNLFGYGSAQPIDCPDPSRPMVIVASCMKHFAVIADAASDDRIDHTEEAPVADAADHLIALVTPLSSAGRAV